MKSYCNNFNNYRKLKNPKISYILNETLTLSILILHYKCDNNNNTIFKIEQSAEILEILGLIYNKNK